MPTAPIIPNSRKPRKPVMVSDAYAVAAATAATSVPGSAPQVASDSAASSDSARRRAAT